MIKKIFVSRVSHQEAAFKAKMAGFKVIGYGIRPTGEYVVFGRK